MASLGPPFGELATKTLRVMKLTALIVLIGCLQVSARGYGQLVTLRVRHAPLEAVLAEIQKQTGYNFVYAKIELESAHPVDLDVHNADIQQVLVQCFKGQPLAYTIEEQYIVVKKRPVEPSVQKSVSDSSKPRTIDVEGKVSDEKGEALAGASVSVKNGKEGTLTNEKGVFVLKKIPPDAVLEISFTGYKLTEVHVAGAKELLAVKLPLANNQLDQAQVIAYGTTTQRLSTGDVTTINAADIEKQSVNNPLLALEGRVPGLFITQSTGLPGSGITVQIQGQNSIANGNDPFYVIDGVPYTSQLLPGLSNILGTSGATGGYSGNISGSPLSYINPSDILSISVLKDADATAIYGSRAANGAIIITTKKGKAGKTKIDFNLQQGLGQVAHKLALLNTSQYLQMRHEAFSNDGASPSLSNGDYDLLFWDTTRNTDWQKVLIGGIADYTNLSGTVSGGNANTQFLLGGTFHRETTVFPGNFQDQRGSFHFNINNVSDNQKFRVQFSANYMADDNHLPTTDLTSAALLLPPDAPPLYNKDGTLNWAPDSSGATTWPYAPNPVNPISYIYSTYTNKTSNLVSDAVFSYLILPELEIKTNFGYTNLQTNETVVNPQSSTAPQNRSFTPSFGVYGNNNSNSWIIEPQVTFKRMISKGKLEFLLGSTVEQNNSRGEQFTGIGFSSDVLISDPSAAAETVPLITTVSTYKYNALFGRLGYNWEDKYLINFTARKDGSSRFGSQNQFHDFESAGVGWIFSSEDFFRKHFPVLSFGKIRASYGTTGNDQIGDYQFLSSYSTTYAQVAYQGTTGLQPTSLANPYLQWEETKKLEFGLDLGILKDRVLVNATYFQNQSSDELLGYILPITTGFNSITNNFPATVKNFGWELSLHSVNIKGKLFSWTTAINLTIPQNSLIAFPNLTTSSYANSLIIGQPINIIRAFHFLAVNDTTGIYQFADSKGNPTYNPSYQTDLIKVININPKVYGGFQNTFQYKGVILDMLFQFVKQIAPNYTVGAYPGPGIEGENQPVSILNRWQESGDNKPVEKFSQNFSLGSAISYYNNSDASYSDASYIRLKNLSLAWQIPNEWVKKIHVETLRVYAQGQNLITVTHYTGLDPESKSFSSLPPLRVITFGLQIGL